MLDAEGKLSIDNVLFATDFSPATANALSYALTIVNRYKSKLHVAHVIDVASFDLLDDDAARRMIGQARAEAEKKLNQLAAPLGLPRDRYEIAVGEGAAAEALLDLIETRHMDVVVVGTHGRRALKKLIMGSVAEEIFRIAPCPVLTVGPHAAPAGPHGPRHILYPVHFAPDPSSAAAYAVSLAERFNASLTVMNVREDVAAAPNQPGRIDEPVEHWMHDHIPSGSDLRKRIRFEVGSGPATAAILDFAGKSGVDLIVMSARRIDPTIAAHLPRPDTAYALATQAKCPLLTVGMPLR